MKLNAIHGHGNQKRRRTAGSDHFAAGTDGAGLLDQLVSHRALAGPEVTFLRALIARVAGDLDSARKLIAHCLEELPGSYQFHSFAAEIGADLPPRARQVADERSRAQALIGPVRAD